MYGELKNVMPQSVQKPYLSVRGRKLPRFMGNSIGPRMEIYESSGLPTPMVPHLHQRNGQIKRKLWVWRAHKWIALVGVETVLTNAGPQTTPFHWGKYTAENGNLCKFGPTYRHGTAFSQNECSYQKEAMGMERPKMYWSNPWKNSTYLCGSINYPVSQGAVQCREWKDAIFRAYHPHGTGVMKIYLHQCNGYIKRKLRVWRAQNCNTLFSAQTVLTSAGPQTTPYHWGEYRAENKNM